VLVADALDSEQASGGHPLQFALDRTFADICQPHDFIQVKALIRFAEECG
jgi:hypothetical protein